MSKIVILVVDMVIGIRWTAGGPPSVLKLARQRRIWSLIWIAGDDGGVRIVMFGAATMSSAAFSSIVVAADAIRSLGLCRLIPQRMPTLDTN
ncbi:hypothetical protein [Mycolicibacterium sp.]|uniref:hypothetical protein n=1 Tax=Mycolicibacterium sp. TaxID=2320850 RepID=UPI001A2FAAE6|nr:hypothetical protein [Mycolicibacterium sp.]MBJ7341540.1 hypothetical protein [Mycolicibacterium sp.]